jgi:competence ComEA-like helix-hairpin-helix protein
MLLVLSTGLLLTRPHTRHTLPPVDAARQIDLNTAGAAELGLLPGIGPTLGQRIVAHRHRYGPFTSVDDVTAVPGIGPVRLDDMRPFIRVEADAADGQSEHLSRGGAVRGGSGKRGSGPEGLGLGDNDD